MKSFLKMTLATIAGLIITGILFFIIMLTSLTAMVAAGNKPVSIPENSVLVLNTGIAIPDRSSDNNPFSSFDPATMTYKKSTGLNDILNNIRKAKTDSKIKGILIEGGLLPAGWATSEEIRNALLDFRESGKFVYAYADYILTQESYFISSSANRIWINPTGSLDFKGLAAEVNFYHKALEKLGIDVQVIRHGKFKGAVEPFMLDKMSDANRLQVSTYVGAIWNHVVSSVAESRDVPEMRIRQMADSLSSYDLGYVTRQGLIDGTLYRDQLEDSIKLACAVEEDKKINYVTMSKYTKVTDQFSKNTGKNKIAIIYASGNIVMGKGDVNKIGGNNYAAELRKARKDSTVKAVVLRVNSPGGNAIASDIIWREVELTSRVKPVVVSMGNYAASGGYYISAAATRIMASPTTITGSIGVFAMIPNVKPLLENKLGITSEVVSTNPFADSPSLTRPMSPYEKDMMQYSVERIYSTFTGVVAQGRKMQKADVDSIGQGRVWSGTDAINIGLVDTIGGLTDAIREAASLAGITEYRTKELPEIPDFYTSLLADLNEEMKMKAIKEELGENIRYYRELKEILAAGGIQARLPYFIEIH